MMMKGKQMVTYRVKSKSTRWTRGGFKTLREAVAYAQKDWAFSEKGLIREGVIFIREEILE
jgi:hypothetical protein